MTLVKHPTIEQSLTTFRDSLGFEITGTDNFAVIQALVDGQGNQLMDSEETSSL